MSNLHIGDTAPTSPPRTTQGEINFHEWLGDGWGVLFSHPADFTPVCTTELGRVAALADKFASRNTKVLALPSMRSATTRSGLTTSRRRRAPAPTTRSSAIRSGRSQTSTA